MAKEHQGKGLGLKMIQALDGVGRSVGCYKNILNCGAKNEPFYVRSILQLHLYTHLDAVHALQQTAEHGRIRDRSSADIQTRASKCRITLNRQRTTSIEVDIVCTIPELLWLPLIKASSGGIGWPSRAQSLCHSIVAGLFRHSPHHAAAMMFRELSPTSNVYRPVVIITQFCSSTSQ